MKELWLSKSWRGMVSIDQGLQLSNRDQFMKWGMIFLQIVTETTLVIFLSSNNKSKIELDKYNSATLSITRRYNRSMNWGKLF